MFDHAQSPRIGQRVPVENPGIQLLTVETLPEVARRGMLAYAEDVDQILIYNGVAWMVVGSGVQTFVGPDEPVADHVGDRWLDTDTYALYKWVGTGWTEITSQQQRRTNLLSARLVRAVENYVPSGTEPAVVVTYDTIAPVSPNTNDFWVDTAANEVTYWDGADWVDTDDSDSLDYPVETWILLAGDRRSTPDGQITLYYDDAEPTGLTNQDIGDAWIDTNDSDTLYIWAGASWHLAEITEDILVNGYSESGERLF